MAGRLGRADDGTKRLRRQIEHKCIPITSQPQKGALQAYTLGHNLHQRYFRLLPPNSLYTRDNMLVHSSAAERCLMSAAAMLAGLMPPLDGRHQLPVPWQPVPIGSVPRTEDALLAQKRPCPRYDDALLSVWSANGTTDELRELNAANAPLFAYLAKHSGANVTHIRHVETLYNTLRVQHDNGLQLPAWTESVYPDRMRALAERTLRTYTERPYMMRMRGGALLTVWLDAMLARRARTLQPDRQLFVYAAHDVTIINMARALGVLERTAVLPDYAAALVLELHHSVLYKDDMEVQLVYYLNGEDKLPKAVQMPGCAEPCALTQFARMLEPVLVRDYDELCKSV